ncbi:MAG: YigZ family protein [Desulfotomaculum sp.]|nr:YigZ family protein [Desulfotomaculum sp.]
MKSCYTTLQKTAQAEIVIKKSRFITTASPVNNEKEADEFIKKVRDKHREATHNVFAYVINEQIQRCSDDGEPSGTAGRPVLDVLNRKGLSKTALVVTRYFGGIMLGAGGLVRAYSEAAVRGIEAAGVIKKELHLQLIVIMDYHWLGMAKKEVENFGAKKINIFYDQKVKMQFFLQPEKADALTERLVELTGAKIKVKKGELSYI